MRCASAAQIRGPVHGGAQLQDIPKTGTRLRATYDVLHSCKGAPVSLSDIPGRHGAEITQLENIYGLDIRLVRKGNRRTGRLSLYLLAGEWFGRVYVDYVADRLATEEAA